MILEPPDDRIYTCPQCDERITYITGPRWAWLLLVIRRVTVHPCHHRLDGAGMEHVLAQENTP